MARWHWTWLAEQGATMRAPSPQVIYNQVKKAVEPIQSTVNPIWHSVKA